MHVDISAPAATVENPLVLTFRFDASLLPADTSAALPGGIIRGLSTRAELTASPVDPFGAPFTRSGSTVNELIYECALCQLSPTTCGNGVMDGGEECDDDNLYTGDDCATDCTFTCGNGVIDPDEDTGLGYEHCDDGNRVSGDCCSSACTVEFYPVCGDGCHVGIFEGCDDGNVVSGDGCNSTCDLEP